MLIFLLTAYILTSLRGTGAIPISTGPPTNPTIIHTVVFGVLARSGCSDTRSSWEIIRSCLFTLAACVYRAIHPNIPDPNASFFKRLRLTIKITFYALMAPEMIIWWALRQRFGAKIIVKKVNEIKPELKWTQTHGQFAQMGGFGRKDTKQVLYPETLIELLKAGQLDIEELQLTEKEINDKSKGDILSKALVAFQTTWFVFECLARLQQGLPLIELEVVTLAFATLNVVTYAVWWYKPLNILCPIYLHVQAPVTNPPTNTETTSDAQDNTTTDPAPHTQSPSLYSTADVAALNSEEEPLTRTESIRAMSDGMQSGKTGKDTGVRKVVTAIRENIVASLTSVAADLKASAAVDGWVLAIGEWLLWKPFKFLATPLLKLVDDEGTCSDSNHVSPFYAMAIGGDKFGPVVLSSSIIGMIFGAIHFLSWHSTFLTHTQLMLWRVSSIVLVVQPSLIFLAWLCFNIHAHTPADSFSESVAEKMVFVFTFVIGFVGTLPYVLARFCVLVIAFLTLRDLPLDAFTNISWTSYIPHL